MCPPPWSYGLCIRFWSDPRMHRLRLSSEGPEVVSRIPDEFFVPYTNRSTRSALFFKHNEIDLQTPIYPLRLSRASIPSPSADGQQSARPWAAGSSSLLITVLIAIGAFLLGGGIAGGIGGALIVKDQAKISRLVENGRHLRKSIDLIETFSLTSSLAILPTVTVAPPSAPTICTLDQAGCPNINNKTYTSTTSPDYTFLQICNTEIVSKTTGKSIDISSSIETQWTDCMNACADYNQKAKKPLCQGATWQLFSTNNPKNNSVCILKGEGGTTTYQPSGDQLCSGVLEA